MWNLLLPFISDILDRILPDDKQREKAKLELLTVIQKGEMKQIEAQSKIVTGEAKSEHWLTAIWRPTTMLVFLGLIVSYWFGYSPDNVDPKLISDLFDIVKMGLSGYIVGRSAEKVVNVLKK